MYEEEFEIKPLHAVFIIIMFAALIGVWAYLSPSLATHQPEKQQVERVRPQPHPKAIKTYKYGYDPIHHKFRWHWE